MPADERRKWIVGLIVSVLLAVGMSAWGLYQWGGNKTHDLMIAKDTELERRMERMENAMDRLNQMAADIAQIKGYLEGKK